MTIIQALQEVNAAMSRPVTLIYADMSEANVDADTLVDSEMPINIVMPIVITDAPSQGGLLKTTFDLNCFFLTKSENITVGYKSIEIENECIAPMRRLAREFIFRLNEHGIIDATSLGILQITYTPAYSSMDANLFGVEVRATVPVVEGISGCNHG